jgi:biotin-dependent carboxylase-like uncharacterized protein
MSTEAFQVLSTGIGITFQDCGRPGWKRFGIPPGGAMDGYAARCANSLLGNPADAPVLEVLWQGAKLRVVQDCRIAITGTHWTAMDMKASQILDFPPATAGLWIYVAVEGGFDAPKFFGSTSTYVRGRLGKPIATGDMLRRNATRPGIANLVEARDYAQPPLIRVWRAPQWEQFSDADKELFLTQEWTVSPQSDRVGYRLTGTPLSSVREQILSEPVCVGTIQVPENGQPIITMRDGPTVGGYSKLAVIDPADVDRAAQCQPGTKIRFTLDESRPEL